MEPPADEDPRFAPDPRVVRLPEWTRDPPQVRVDASREWRPVHPMLVEALDALRDGGAYVDLERRAAGRASELDASQVRAVLRGFLWKLRLAGCLDIPFEPTPERFAGRYRALRELGRGGVGVAVLCEDERTRAPVVVKHAWGYLRPVTRNERALREEAEILRALDHPGIAKVHDAFEERGLFHMVRDFADGPPMKARHARGMTVAARAAFLEGAVDALDHAQARGFLMMDPKPANFATRDGRPFVIDAGGFLPHEHGRLLRELPSGTRGFVAPEFLDRRGADERSAVFSMGCLHHALATGETPGHRWSAAERAAALDAAGVGAEERALVLHACADAPDERPQTYAALREALSRLRKGAGA